MYGLIAIFALAQSIPGPLDAFRANYHAINVAMRYDIVRGRTDPATIADGRLWKGGAFAFSEDPQATGLARTLSKFGKL